MTRIRFVGVVLTAFCLIKPWAALGQPPARSNVGQFFPTIVEPIEQDDLDALRSTVLAYVHTATAQGQTPTLVFEFRPGDSEPGKTSFYAASDLAEFLARKLGGAKTVAFVPESMSGFALLPVLACDEIVIGPEATLGPIGAEDHPVTNSQRESIRELARAKGRDEDLLVGLLEPSRDLRQVRTTDGATHFVLAEKLDEFRKSHQVLEEAAAWEGQRGVLSADRARQTIARLQAKDRAEIAEVYGLPGTADLQSAPSRPFVIPIHGRIDPLAESFLLRQIDKAKGDGANLIFFDINSPGGLYGEADKVANAIARLKDVKTVAFINERAIGVSALIALACDEIVFRKGARLGNIRQQIVDSDGQTQDLDPRLTRILADRAEDLARQKGHPSAVARALVDPDTVVLRARDKKSGAVVLVLETAVTAEPGRFEVLETVKSADGEILTLTDESARRLQMGDRVVRDFNEMQSAFGLRGKMIRAIARTWVDTLVDTLNEPWMRGVLLFVGFFMLIMESQAAGHRAAGHPGDAGVPPLFLERVSRRHGRHARDPAVPGRRAQHRGRAVRVPGNGHLRHERGAVDPGQRDHGQPHLRLAEPGVRVQATDADRLPGAGDDRRGDRGRHPARTLFPVRPVLQSPDPQARARRGRVRGPRPEAGPRSRRAVYVPDG